MKLSLEHIAPGDEGDLAACRGLRYQVFVDEQGVPETIEMDDRDGSCSHLLLRADGEAIATGRLLPEGRIGRMAVNAAWRGHGYGQLILDGLMACAAHQGHTRSSLHAQHSAIGFYEQAGFLACGDSFVEAGILHLPMQRDLPPAPDSLPDYLRGLIPSASA